MQDRDTAKPYPGPIVPRRVRRNALSVQHLAQDKERVGRTLGDAARVIGVPFRSKREIDGHVVSGFLEPELLRRPDAIEQLRSKGRTGIRQSHIPVLLCHGVSGGTRYRSSIWRRTKNALDGRSAMRRV